MTIGLTEEDLRRWHDVVAAHQLYIRARMQLWRSPSLVELIRKGMNNPDERATAVDIAAMLPDLSKKEVLPDLLALTSYSHGLTAACMEIVMSLPKEWLLSVIEHYAEPILQNGTSEEYQALLQLYARIDKELAMRLAKRALYHPDSDVRSIGEEYGAQGGAI